MLAAGSRSVARWQWWPQRPSSHRCTDKLVNGHCVSWRRRQCLLEGVEKLLCGDKKVAHRNKPVQPVCVCSPSETWFHCGAALYSDSAPFLLLLVIYRHAVHKHCRLSFPTVNYSTAWGSLCIFCPFPRLAFTLELKLCSLLHNCCTFLSAPDCHPCLRSLPQCVFICRSVGLLKITKLPDPAVCHGFVLGRDFSGLLFLAAADSFPTLVFCNGEGNDGGLHFGCGHTCICACERISSGQTTAAV